MSKIIKLDKNLANQIAAGEVVERPVSVIKELVENSIDAGAKKIKIEIINGGIDEIIVSDDGAGIEKEELSLAIEKYSTSKIKNLDDLYNIMTFGFRGEALSSISSVSVFKITSKYEKSDFGYSLELQNGEKSDIYKDIIDKGTKIEVKNLFYNTPARLNYLKKPRTEYGHIVDYVNSISLSYPEISFELVNEGKTTLKYNFGDDLKSRIYGVFGYEFSDNLLEISSEIPGLKLNGYISDPKVSFSNKNRQLIFVNNRPISSPLIYKAIHNAYNRFIPHNLFPGYVINIFIDPTQIDVNVHPRKLEIRFADESDIFRKIYSTVNQKLEGVSLVSQTNFRQDSTEQKESKKEYYTGSGTKFKSYSPYKDTSHNPAQFQINEAINFTKEIINNDEKTDNDSGDLHETKLGRIIGQTFNSYIVVETSNSIKILDQHALAERIIYEKLVKGQYESKAQGLLIAENINLTQSEESILKDNIEIFYDMGFQIEFLSSNIVSVCSIPDFIKKENLREIITGIISDIGEQNISKSKTLEEVRNKIFAYASCRSAIKFGNKLNLFEMNKLLNDSVLDYSATCPHGRPVIYEIGLDELKDKYER